MKEKPVMASQALEQMRRISHVTWVGLWINIVICVGKIVTGFLGNSRAVVADGIHSASDMVTDIAVLVGVRFWVAPADAEHPYGHQRLESLISLLIGVLLGVAGIGIAYDAIARMGEPRTSQVGSILALGMTLFSVVAKELLYRWTLAQGKELRSSAVEANAWDHRSDALSSIPTAFAVAVALWFPAWSVIDLWAAILVSIFVMYAAWQICLPSLQVLLDKGADQSVHDKLAQFVLRLDHVKGVHDIRTRYMGQAIMADMHVRIDGALTVAEADVIAHAIEEELYSEAAANFIGVEVCNALIHIDPWVPNFHGTE